MNNYIINTQSSSTESTSSSQPIKTFVVDCIMGSGKSSAAINFINHSPRDKKFLVITPYLDEIKRYKQCCHTRHFKEPSYEKTTSKFNSIKYLLRQGENVVSTHALFHRFDQELINTCETLGYTLIMDEVTDVVEEYPITNDDITNLLNNYCDLDNDTGKMTWREECQTYEGKFSEIKNMCNTGSVVMARSHMLLWLFPVEVFAAFERVFILTYMFNAQIQRYYYDYCGVRYTYLGVEGNSFDNYRFCRIAPENSPTYDYRHLINIITHEKLNIIGKDKHSLSKGWYTTNNKTAVMKQLKNNTMNFFHHLVTSNSKEVLWTTFKDFRDQISGKGYTKGFLSINARATNLYKDRKYLAYLVNVFFNPMVKGFFQDQLIDVDEDGYALSEMLQWIWRSAIREGNEIWVYVPSSRMRGLLIDWIDKNSPPQNTN